MAEDVGDGVGLVEAGDGGSNAQVAVELVLDGAEFSFTLGPLRDQGGSGRFRGVGNGDAVATRLRPVRSGESLGSAM